MAALLDDSRSVSMLNVSGDHQSLEQGDPPDEENPIVKDMELAWANNRAFFIELVGLSLLASLMGLGSFGYNYIVGDLLEKWLSASGSREYPKDPKSVELLGGSALWIPLCWAGGTLVGVLKWVIDLDAFPSFLVEIREQHADPKGSFKVCLCCMASLASGAAMGPEAGLAAAGGGLGCLIAGQCSKLLGSPLEEAEERRRLFVLGGIAAAFGTILPAPWVALLICVECSFAKQDEEAKTLLIWGRKWLMMLGFTASFAFVIRYQVKPIPSVPLPGALLDRYYENDMPLRAIALGILAALSALVHFIFLAVFKKMFTRLGSFLEKRSGVPVRKICLCSLSGLLTGVIGYLVPLSLTDGKTQIGPTILHAQHMTTTNLILVAVTKSISNSVSTAGGMVGGPFFPVLYIGVVVGELTSRIPGLGKAVFTIPICMAALPGAVMSIPFTLLALPLSQFNLGSLWCVPILVAIISSYTLMVGSGFVKRLASRAR